VFVNFFKVVLLFLSLFYALNSFAEKPIEERQFDTEKIQKYQESKDFEYINYEQNTFSLSEYIKSWLESWLSRSSNPSRTASLILEFIKWAVLITGILFILSNIFGISFSSLLLKKHDIKDNILYDVLQEDINALDFEQQIAEHLKNKNYRYAIRMHYLKALKLLSDKDLINWQKFKTNAAYLNELNDKPILKQSFAKITSLFSYIWYGEFSVDESNFETYQKEFEQFYKQSEN